MARLKAAIAAAALVAFWRRFIKPHLSPALSELISPALPSLSRRWSAGRLQAALAQEQDGDDQQAVTTPQRTLAETWSPSSLGRFLKAFSRGSAPSPEPSSSSRRVGSPAAAASSVRFSTWCEFMEDSMGESR